MTVNEAIEFGNMWLEVNEDCKDSSTYIFFQMAIKALEQQTCEDCISREAVNTLIDELARAISDERCFVSKGVVPRGRETSLIMQDILALPSVTLKTDVLDKIKTEILDEAEYAYADFDRYKEDILHAESDELPDDDFRYGLERAVEIINKYKTESEGAE